MHILLSFEIICNVIINHIILLHIVIRKFPENWSFPNVECYED